MQPESYLEQLKIYFAKTFVIYMKTCALHANIVGPRFREVRSLSEKQCEDVFEAIDTLAGRIHALGDRTPMISLHEILKASQIHEQHVSPKDLNLEGAIQELITIHRQMSGQAMNLANAGEDRNDTLTADFVRIRAGEHEKSASVLNSLLEQ